MVTSDCRCYVIPVEETIEHLFLHVEVATRIWNHFRYASGILDPMLFLISLCGFLWKRINTYFSDVRVILGDTVLKFMYVRFKLNCSTNSWPHILAELSNIGQSLSIKSCGC